MYQYMPVKNIGNIGRNTYTIKNVTPNVYSAK